MVLASATLKTILTAIGPQPATLDTPDPSLRLLRRQWKDAQLLLLFNESAQPLTHTLTLSATHSVYTWNAQTAAITPASAPSATISLQLDPYETRILVIR